MIDGTAAIGAVVPLGADFALAGVAVSEVFGRNALIVFGESDHGCSSL